MRSAIAALDVTRRPINRPPRPYSQQLRVQTLRNYAEVFDVNVRPELTPNELSVAVARCVSGAR